jgi:hypothetical protein
LDEFEKHKKDIEDMIKIIEEEYTTIEKIRNEIRKI